MTITIATEQCGCPVPMIIGWAEAGWEGMSGGTVAMAFRKATPEGYALWSGPFKADIMQHSDDTVTVTRKDSGVCLVAEYKKL